MHWNEQQNFTCQKSVPIVFWPYKRLILLLFSSYLPTLPPYTILSPKCFKWLNAQLLFIPPVALPVKACTTTCLISNTFISTLISTHCIPSRFGYSWQRHHTTRHASSKHWNIFTPTFPSSVNFLNSLICKFSQSLNSVN